MLAKDLPARKGFSLENGEPASTPAGVRQEPGVLPIPLHRFLPGSFHQVSSNVNLCPILARFAGARPAGPLAAASTLEY